MGKYYREATDTAFQERLVRDHLERHMPVIELHRNFGLPLSAVKKWIALYTSGGRAALNAEADKIAAVWAKPLTAKQLTALRTALGSVDPQTVDDALAMVGARRVQSVLDLVVGLIANKNSVISAIKTLGDCGAVAQLEAARRLVGKGYAGWIDGALEAARNGGYRRS